VLRSPGRLAQNAFKFSMKSTPTASTHVKPRPSEIIAKISAAQKSADAAKKTAREAKAKLKKVRKDYKLAKKTAKAFRRQLKELKKDLVAAKAAITRAKKTAAKKRKAKPSRKTSLVSPQPGEPAVPFPVPPESVGSGVQSEPAV
jgi:chromosome segregation ATPase